MRESWRIARVIPRPVSFSRGRGTPWVAAGGNPGWWAWINFVVPAPPRPATPVDPGCPTPCALFPFARSLFAPRCLPATTVMAGCLHEAAAAAAAQREGGGVMLPPLNTLRRAGWGRRGPAGPPLISPAEARRRGCGPRASQGEPMPSHDYTSRSHSSVDAVIPRLPRHCTAPPGTAPPCAAWLSRLAASGVAKLSPRAAPNRRVANARRSPGAASPRALREKIY